MPELPLVNEMGDEAVFIRLWLELPLTKDVGDDTVFTGLLLKSPPAKDAGDELLFTPELELAVLTGDELALTKSDDLFDHSFIIIAPLSFYHLVKPIFVTIWIF